MASPTKVARIRLGSQGLEVSQQGFGAMSVSGKWGAPKPESEMIKLIRYAVESGITFIDTADAYGPHTSKILIGKAIKGIRDKVQLATKFGNVISGGEYSVRGDPAYVRQALADSLKRLDVESVDLYYQHRVDPKVPIEITIGVLKEFVKEGKIKYIGLSEASPADIRRAHAVHPITAVQMEYWSLWSRDCEEVVPTCRELGIGIVPYSPLGRGFFAGLKADDFEANDYRKTMPRFLPENYASKKALYDRLVAIAIKKNATPGQLALAWVQHQGPDVAPIPGTTQRKNLEENMGALAIKLSKEELKALEDAVPLNEVAGERYPAMFMEKTWLHTNSPPLSSWKGE